jgi:SAM-dependent methyltransferase
MIEQLYKTWGIEKYATEAILADRESFTCYEGVEEQLAGYTAERYKANPDQVVKEVFDIYRSINIVPIVYYTEAGLIKSIKSLAQLNGNQVERVDGDFRLGLGNNQGQTINRFCFPNMMTAEPKGRGSNSLRDRFLDDRKLERAIRLCFDYRDGNNLVSPTALRRALELVTGENIQNFKPLNARAIIDHLCPVMWGNIYDYSAGYGGRLLGIATAKMRYNYTGIDPNTETFNHLNYLNSLILTATGNNSTVVQAVSEEYQPHDMDMAFSSPPYFNLEKYSDEPTQCMVRYTTLDDWFEGYVVPTMKNIHRGLNNDGIFATNIADYKSYGNKEYQVVERWIATAQSLGFNHASTVKMMLNTRPGVGNDKVAGREKWEGVYVFTK